MVIGINRLYFFFLSGIAAYNLSLTIGDEFSHESSKYLMLRWAKCLYMFKENLTLKVRASGGKVFGR